VSYQVGSACYDTALMASQASASSQVGAVVVHGTTSYVVNASSSDGASITYALAPVSGGASLTVVSPYTAQPCNMLTHQDGLQLGWLVAGVWVAAWAIKFMVIAVKDWGDQHGNA
jgi:hypothetical protein